MRKLLSVLSSTLKGGVRGGLLFLLFFASVSAIYASDTQVDGIWYDFDSSTKTASVTYRGDDCDRYDGEYSGAVVIPETVTYDGTTYSVTSIGYAAFDDCSSLTSVTIGESVTSIGRWAFSYCSSLTSVTIGESVTSIGDYAFRDCSSLTSVTINSNAIVSKAYSSDSNISHIFGSKVTEYIIGESVTSIGDYAFRNCTSLTSVTIPNSVTSIGDYAFAYCTSLTSVTIGESVTSIGERAFYSCYSLTSVTIPNSVTSIGGSAFNGCSSLTSITIGNSVTGIGDYAFYECTSLTSVTIGKSVTSIGERAFEGCSSLPVKNNLRYADTYLVEAVNKTLSTYSIKEGTKWVGDNAFRGCSSLTSVTIPNSVTSIGGSAFYGCSSLNEVILGTGLKTIDEYAFQGCTKLYDVYCYAAEPPTTSESSFENYNAFLHVPCESQRLYLLDINFGNFKFIECVSSDEVSTDGVVVTPSTNDVTIIWPTETGADTYTIVIKKGDEVFCTLTFNADGQLLNIAFAPSRDGNNHPAQYAAQTVSGYRFTVTGLTEATRYAYSVTTKDASNQALATYSGEFTTLGGTETAVEDIVQKTSNYQKIIRDNQLLILRDGKTYNVMGAEIQ